MTGVQTATCKEHHDLSLAVRKRQEENVVMPAEVQKDYCYQGDIG